MKKDYKVVKVVEEKEGELLIHIPKLEALEKEEVISYTAYPINKGVLEGLYFLYDCDLHLLYIGISNNIRRRVRQHKLDQRWRNEIKYVSIYITEYPEVFESIYQHYYKPKYCCLREHKVEIIDMCKVL